MKNKVYIDYNYGGVYWSIEDIRRNANLLRRILKEASDSVILKLANNEIAIEEIMAIQSPLLKGREEYQVLFLFFPKPLNSIAFAMTSILSIEETISGNSRVAAHFSLLKRLSFSLFSSKPLACCATDISWYSLWISGIYLRARETEYEIL